MSKLSYSAGGRDYAVGIPLQSIVLKKSYFKPTMHT